MSILVIQIPPRPRLRSRDAGSGSPSAAAAVSTDRFYVLTPDGLAIQAQGVCAPAMFPKADSVVAVLSDNDVAWHRLTLPKAPAARLRAALGAMLEDALLADPATIHFALAPKSTAGQSTWVAAVDRAWLRNELAVLEKAHVFIERVVPSSWPDDVPTGHFSEAEDLGESTGSTSLTWSHSNGVASFRLGGGLARAALPDSALAGARFTASPSAALAAEQWLGAPVNVMTAAQRCLQAARTLWNLRQFELARRRRGVRAVREALRQFFSTTWRPVRIGLVAIVLAQLVGLNLWASHQRHLLDARRQAMVTLLQTTFPQVRAVLDAPIQMQHEVQTLRALAGKAGETDLEPMLQAAAVAWPVERSPVEALRYEGGKLTLSATGWSDAEIGDFRNRLRLGGWVLEAVDGKLIVARNRDAIGGAR